MQHKFIFFFHVSLIFCINSIYLLLFFCITANQLLMYLCLYVWDEVSSSLLPYSRRYLLAYVEKRYKFLFFLWASLFNWTDSVSSSFCRKNLQDWLNGNKRTYIMILDYVVKSSELTSKFYNNNGWSMI